MSDRISEIRNRVEAATAGPWAWVEREVSRGGWGHSGPDLVAVKGEEAHQKHYEKGGVYEQTKKHHQCGKEHVLVSFGYDADGVDVDGGDAVFIAQAREDVPYLLDELAAALARIETLTAALNDAAGRLEETISRAELVAVVRDLRATLDGASEASGE